MAGNNSVGSFEEDLLSCDIPDECCLTQKTNKDNDKDEVCKEKCFHDEGDDINKAKSLSIVGWTVLKRFGGSYDLKTGIVHTYDISTRFFKVKYQDGTMDTIIERELLRCLGDPHERGFPCYLFIEPPLPEGEKPKPWRALRMNATPNYHQRTVRSEDTGEYESSDGEEAEMGGSYGSQNADGDDTVGSENGESVGSGSA